MSKLVSVQRFTILAITLSTAAGAATVAAQSARPYDSLRQQLDNKSNHKLDLATARNVSEVAVRNQYILSMLPGGASDAAVFQAADALGDRQLEWQELKRPGIREETLIARMNAYFETKSLPEYLQFRPRDIRRARVLLRIQVPELSALDGPKAKTRGNQFAPNEMSPLEAFLVADSLLHLKTFNDDFLRTTSEDHRAFVHGLDTTARKPGISALPVNPRRGELQNHIAKVAEKRHMSVEDGINAIGALLDGGDK